MSYERLETGDREKRFLGKPISKRIRNRVICGAGIISAIIIGTLGLKSFISYDSKTTKIGFEDIGELATQSAYCTEISITDNSRTLFGINIPFTQSKYIYSYDVEIKAGYDFNEIKWEENGNIIKVELPEAKVLSCNVDPISLKVYHEEESIFNQLTLDENNGALIELEESAEKSAIENGLLENARTNAESILTGFFGNVYDLNEYEIEFVDN